MDQIYSEIRNRKIHLNSIDKDGTEEGFDISLINKVNKICKVPLVIGGECL